MSKLRNRNIRTKIHAVAKWGQYLSSKAVASHPNGKLFDNDGITTTADSGIAEIAPLAPKLNQQKSPNRRLRSRRSNWNLNAAFESETERQKQNESGHDSSDDESKNSCSSVDTLNVLDEIRNLEDSVKSMSAESYNSWTEEYENDSTQLVKAEFDRMERVLQCREPIPAHYDKDEYKLWIKTFPLLSLVSRTSSLDYRKQSPTAFTPLEPSTSPKFCDNSPPTPILTKTANNIIDNYDNLDNLFAYPSLPPKNQTLTHSTTSTTTYTNKYLAINNTINPRVVNIQGNHSFLQLAPLNLTSGMNTKRQSFKPINTSFSGKATSSSNSGRKRLIITREKSNSSGPSVYTAGRTADWLKDVHDFNDFRHFVKNQQGVASRITPEIRKKSSRTSKTESFKSSSEFIVLPPIDNNEFRSSSAATISSLGKAPILPLGRLKHPPVYPLYENEKESDHNDGFVSFRHRKRKYK